MLSTHAILSGMFFQLVLRGCWFITWQAGSRSCYRYSSILSKCWPGCGSDCQAIFYKDWSWTSPNRTGPYELVGSKHWHQPGLANLVLPPRLDRSDYSEPWMQCRFPTTLSHNNPSQCHCPTYRTSWPHDICLSLSLLRWVVVSPRIASMLRETRRNLCPVCTIICEWCDIYQIRKTRHQGIHLCPSLSVWNGMSQSIHTNSHSVVVEKRWYIKITCDHSVKRIFPLYHTFTILSLA